MELWSDEYITIKASMDAAWTEGDTLAETEHLAGEEVYRDPSKGAMPVPYCVICGHRHRPIHLGGNHLD